MFGAYVRFKCIYTALRKSSDNLQQHLFLGQRRIIGNTMWIWLSSSSQRRILDLWNKVCPDFGKFNSLMNTLTDSRSNMSLSSSFLLTLMSNTYTCTHTRSKYNKEDDDLQLLISPSQPLGRSQVYTKLSSHVSVPYLVHFNIYVYTSIV